MKMGQLFDNSFTLRYCSLKLSLSLHKQIKSAAFEGQDRYCIISSDWCIISSVVTVYAASAEPCFEKPQILDFLDPPTVHCNVRFVSLLLEFL